MRGTNFGGLVLGTTVLFFVVRHVSCEESELVDLEGTAEKSVENLLDDLGREFGNSSLSEILNFWGEDDEREAKSLEETPKNPTKNDPKLGGGGAGGAGGHGGSAGGQKKRKGQKKQQSLVRRIMPIMFIPFMISTAIIPLMIFVIKLLFIKAAIVGKVAVTLGIISFFKRRTNGGGVYNYNAWKTR